MSHHVQLKLQYSIKMLNIHNRFVRFFFSKNVLIVTVVALVRVCVASVRN